MKRRPKSNQIKDVALQKLMASLGLTPNGKAGRNLPCKLREMILTRDNWTCYYCEEKLEPGLEQIDHRVPRAWGGSDDPNNLVAACRYCNQAKSDLLIECLRITPEQFQQDLFRLLQEPQNPILKRRIEGAVNGNVIISDSLRNSDEAAIERLVGVLEVRCRSEELKEAHRRHREKRRGEEEFFDMLNPQKRRLNQFVDAILSGQLNFGSEQGDDQPKE